MRKRNYSLFILYIFLILALILLIRGSKLYNNINNLSRDERNCFQVSRHKIKGNSLEPFIHNGEKVLALFGYYNCHSLRRNDIVIIRFKTQPKKLYVKRLLGLPGDVVIIKDGHLWVNGHLLTNTEGEPYLINETAERKLKIPLRNHKITSGHYLVLSNQTSPLAYDSRLFGYIEREHIIGKIKKLWINAL